MANTARSVCHLRQTLRPHEVWPLMGLTPEQVLEKMNAHLESLEYKSEIKNAWIAATEAYNKSNGGHTTHRNLLCGKQQDRDKNLLDKRYELLSEIVFKGLFPPGTLHLYFVMAANYEGKRYQGTTICDKYKHDTTPDTVIVDVLIYDKAETQCNDTRMKWLTGTLLHELVHAVVDVYTCACQRCKEGSVEAEGLTGHGPVWMGISLKVEKTMQQIFGYRCWLGRTQSLAIEHHASQHRHSEKELRAHEVNEGLYCESRISCGEAEPDKSIPFNRDDLTQKEGN